MGRVRPAELAIAPPPGRAGPVVVAAALACMVLFSEGAVQRLVAPEAAVDGNAVLRVMWLPVYAVIAALALTQIRQIADVARRLPVLMALVVLASVSFLWSIDPALSLRRGVGVAVTTVFGLYLVARFSFREILMLLGALWLGLAAMSFVAGLAAPGFARDYEIHIGAWRGFWYEKNQLGGHMARASLIFAALALIDAPRRWLWSVGLALTLALVALSTSTTSLLATLIGGALLAGGAALQGRRAAALVGLWAGVTLAAALAALIALQPDVFLALFGKDATLTGRTDIWSALAGSISQRPLLGFGYGAFWDPASQPAYWVRAAVDWEAPTAHNGWLEIALATGLLGVFCYAASFLGVLVQALRRAHNHRLALFAIAYLAQIAVFSFSESLLLEFNSLVWVTYVCVAGALARGLGDEAAAVEGRARRRAGAPLRRNASGLI
ncbi:MAG: O-antigen ligase [Pseudomonadota bacterium]